MVKLKENTIDFNIQDFLNTEEDVRQYLQSAIEENNPEFLITAIGDVIRSKGFTKISKKMNVSREGLYKSFSGNSRPYYDTVFNALNVLGLKLSLTLK